MRRLLCLLLVISFLLCGCSYMGERIKEPVTFYYVRKDYRQDMGAVISTEVREASGHRYDLPYLLALYSMGPADKDLISPLPENVTILPVEHSEDGIVLSLLDDIQIMTDAEFTVASACLAMTCMELIHTEQVTVICGDRSVTIHSENLLMVEDHPILNLPEDNQ